MFKLQKTDSGSGERNNLLFTVFWLFLSGHKATAKRTFYFKFSYLSKIRGNLFSLYSVLYSYCIRLYNTLFNQSEVAKQRCAHCGFLTKTKNLIKDMLLLGRFSSGRLNEQALTCASCQLNKPDAMHTFKRSSKAVLNRHLYHHKKKCNKVFRLSWREISKC